MMKRMVLWASIYGGVFLGNVAWIWETNHVLDLWACLWRAWLLTIPIHFLATLCMWPKKSQRARLIESRAAQAPPPASLAPRPVRPCGNCEYCNYGQS